VGVSSLPRLIGMVFTTAPLCRICICLVCRRPSRPGVVDLVRDRAVGLAVHTAAHVYAVEIASSLMVVPACQYVAAR